MSRVDEEEKAKVDTMDSFRICPFNKSHIVLARNFVNHVLKCEKTLPIKIGELGAQFEKCQFNVSHYVAKGEMGLHLLECEDFNEFQAKYFLENAVMAMSEIVVKKKKDGEFTILTEEDERYAKEWE